MKTEELNKHLIDLIGIACLALNGEYDKEDAYDKLFSALIKWREMKGLSHEKKSK